MDVNLQHVFVLGKLHDRLAQTGLIDCVSVRQAKCCGNNFKIVGDLKMQRIFTAPSTCPCWGGGRLHSVLSSFKVPGCTRLIFLFPLFAKARKRERGELCTDPTGFFLEATHMCSPITDQSKPHVQVQSKGDVAGQCEFQLSCGLTG